MKISYRRNFMTFRVTEFNETMVEQNKLCIIVLEWNRVLTLLFWNIINLGYYPITNTTIISQIQLGTKVNSSHLENYFQGKLNYSNHVITKT